ncbi:MAG TPA: hypothetical protein VGL99_03400 [Chloroflexota bacterium]|jgi:hypothetical protein
MRRKLKPINLAHATAQLTPNRGGDYVTDDALSLRNTQSNHGTTGNGPDEDRADADDYKVKGQSRPQ